MIFGPFTFKGGSDSPVLFPRWPLLLKIEFWLLDQLLVVLQFRKDSI